MAGGRRARGGGMQRGARGALLAGLLAAAAGAGGLLVHGAAAGGGGAECAAGSAVASGDEFPLGVAFWPGGSADNWLGLHPCRPDDRAKMVRCPPLTPPCPPPSRRSGRHTAPTPKCPLHPSRGSWCSFASSFRMLVSSTRKKVCACGERWSRLDRSALGLAEVGQPGGGRVGEAAAVVEEGAVGVGKKI